MDQEQIYQKYLKEKLEKYGAVKIYFASRWNILVSKPEYLLTVFKNEDIYAKSGNHIKIPNSVLSSYTGDNIISAHGELWKLYREVLASSIQFPDNNPVYEHTAMLLEIIEKELNNDNSIAITDLLQRYSLNNVGKSIIGVDFQALEGQSSIMHQKIKYVKSQIFRPFYMNFPNFDSFPIPSRLTARKEVEQFRKWYGEKLVNEYKPELPNSAATKLVNALDDGRLTEKQFLDNAIIVMVAGHENPLLLMLSVLYILGKNPQLQTSLRMEKIPLQAIIYETLRMYPPLGQIINRCTTKATVLGENIFIPKGVYVGYNNLATGRDRGVWGDDAGEFKPSRWGKTLEEINQKFSQAKRMATLPAFHGRKRACLGEKFALFEIKECISAIIQKYRISLGDNWKQKFTPAGPICPVGLQIKFEKV